MGTGVHEGLPGDTGGCWRLRGLLWRSKRLAGDMKGLQGHMGPLRHVSKPVRGRMAQLGRTEGPGGTVRGRTGSCPGTERAAGVHSRTAETRGQRAALRRAGR